MAEPTIPTFPKTPSTALASGPMPVSETSLERLDGLLETYLDLLDQYTTLRTQLSKQFRDGFFSLARANHTSTSLGRGRRYGEDGYDERMKAQRRIVYDVEEAGNGRDGHDSKSQQTNNQKDQVSRMPVCSVSIQKTKQVATSDETSTQRTEQAEDSKAPDRPSTGEPAPAPASPPTRNKRESSSGTTAKARPLPSTRDPLNWYGILVPPPLRQAQAFFISGVESSMPGLLNTSAAMYELEIRITKLRTELGLRDVSEADLDVDENLQAQEETVSTTSPSLQPSRATQEVSGISTTTRKRLVQRPTEPRLQLLKLDG